MKKSIHRAAALLLVAVLLLSLGGCGKTAAYGYKIVDTLAESGYVMAFREGDQVGDYVAAALGVLASQGVLQQLSLTWLGEDESLVKADPDALDRFEEIPEREFILGFSDNAPPMAFGDAQGWRGFDIELAQRVCGLLGWTLKLQAIPADNFASELLSGDVDAVWGLFEGVAATGITVSPPYLETDLVLVVLAGSGLKGRSSLRGKFLSMGADAVFAGVLDENEKLRDSLGSVSRLASGSMGCFAELDSRACDVVLVSSATAAYYMSGRAGA